jgi:hypothetical protein
MPVKKYRVYCNDESTFVTGWSESEPSTCYNNNTHTIDTNKTAVTDFNLDEVAIIQTEPNIKNTFFLESVTDLIDAGQTKDIDIPTDVDFYLYGVHLNLFQPNIGDLFSVWVNKDTVIGLTTGSSTGNTISVDQTSVDNAVLGYYLKFGTEYYKIINKDTTTITLNGTPTVSSGVPVMMTYFMIFKKVIRTTYMKLGFSLLGAKKMLSEWTAGVTYENTSQSRKEFNIDLETTLII